MASIPGMENINLFSGTDFGLLLSRAVLGFKIVGFLIVVAVALYFFIIKPKRYKDIVEIIDFSTNQKYIDKGYLKRNRNGTQEYVLLGRMFKGAKLDIPQSSTFTTKKGKKIYHLVKYGSGDYNWASAKEVWDRDKKELKKYHVTNLTDENWTKDKIKRESEKKSKIKGMEKWIPQIAIGAVVLMFIISAWYLTGVMKETVNVGGSVMGRANEISADFAEVAKACKTGGNVRGSSTAPPPGV